MCAKIAPDEIETMDSGLPAQCATALTAALRSATLQPLDAQLQFRSDGQYVQSGAMRMRASFTFSKACLDAVSSASIATDGEAPATSAPAQAFTCSQMVSSMGLDGPSVQCTPASGGCRCTMSTEVDFDASGPYRTKGPMLFLDGETMGNGYCVQEKTATFFARSGGIEGRFQLARISTSTSEDDIDDPIDELGVPMPIAGGLPPIGGTSVVPPIGFAGSFAAGTPSFEDAGSPVVPEPQLDGVELSRGSARLIELFVADAGIYLVLEDALVLLSHQGVELARVSAPRPHTTAAFDGSLIVVADGAQLTSYDLDLNPITSANLVEPCASGVLVSGSRFICGPENDWDRVFYTYDASTGTQLATSAPNTYHGIPMRRVPGTDDFVTVTTGLSPSDFHLYSVLSTNEASYINESPYHGDFRVTNVYAWDAAPAAHVVTDTGILLQIHGEGCESGGSAGSGAMCFVRNGALGSLTGNQVYLAMDTDSSGKLYGIVDPTGIGYAGCQDTCALQRIDVASRTIEHSQELRFGAGSFVALRFDANAGAVIAGYALASATGSSLDPYPGYRVAAFAQP